MSSNFKMRNINEQATAILGSREIGGNIDPAQGSFPQDVAVCCAVRQLVLSKPQRQAPRGEVLPDVQGHLQRQENVPAGPLDHLHPEHIKLAKLAG
jgi:hypothetical protein